MMGITQQLHVFPRFINEMMDKGAGPTIVTIVSEGPI
jgi:hypothetical protein